MLEVVRSKYAKGSNGSYHAVRVNANTLIMRQGKVERLNPKFNYFVQWDCHINPSENIIYSSGYNIRTFRTLKEVKDFLADIN